MIDHMRMSGNTILITGGGSGIGKGLAESFHKLGNEVIIAGRRRKALEETAAAHPGMICLLLNLEDTESIRDFATHISVEHPKLNVLVNNAGIMRMEKIIGQREDVSDAEAIVTTNLLGPCLLYTSDAADE